jgi:hypothetical protein
MPAVAEGGHARVEGGGGQPRRAALGAPPRPVFRVLDFRSSSPSLTLELVEAHLRELRGAALERVRERARARRGDARELEALLRDAL